MGRPFFYETNKIFRNHFTLGIPLGKGSSAEVRRAECKEKSWSFAAKMMSIDNYYLFLREVQVLKKLCFPTVVQLYEAIEETKKLYLVEECLMGGNLRQLQMQRNEQKQAFNEEEVA